jgi:hypothetical protein
MLKGVHAYCTLYRQKAIEYKILKKTFSSVADPDPGSGAFLTPGPGLRNRFFPDPGSQTHIFESILKIFWVKTSTIL